VRSDRKGGSYENHVAATLSDWYAPLRDESWHDMPVYRLPFRRRDPNGDNDATDWRGGRDLLHRPEIEFPFAIECKKSEVWELGGLFTAPKWPVWAWWDQAVDQSVVLRLPPLLVFSKNRNPDYAIVEESSFQWFAPHLTCPTIIRAQSKRGPVVLALLEDLVRVSPAVLRSSPPTPVPSGGCPAPSSSASSSTQFRASLQKLRQPFGHLS